MSRRLFLRQTSLLGAASLLGIFAEARAEPPPEVATIRLVHAPSICLSPQYLAEEFLRLEGFSRIEYVPYDADPNPHMVVAAGRADMTMDSATALVSALDVERPIAVLAGVHGGCYEVFGNERIRSIRDLRGKNVAIWTKGGAEHVYLSSMMAYVGMDPRTEVNWVATGAFDGAMQLFTEGRVDAFLGFPPQPQQIRAKKIGHVVVNTAQDRPWSQHFCCMVAGNKEFVRKHPVAAKRALRAILKAADLCAREPERAANFMVKKGYEPSYDIALEVVKEVSYNAWRAFNPEDTLRFHALRLHEVGMIISSPNKLIAQGTDWRLLSELKRELKA